MTGDERQPSLARLTLPVGDRDHAIGPVTAPVTLVEYGDYECPYCRAAVPIVQELQQLLGDEIRFVFRHFPLASLHSHARRAAEAAEAAGAQGMFFEMHAALFEHQEALEDADLVRYAEELGRHEPVPSRARRARIRRQGPRGLRQRQEQWRTWNADVLPGRRSV